MFVSVLLRGAALAALLVPSACFAQSAPPAASPAAAQQAASQPSAATQAVVEERIRTLQQELAITPSQMPLWDAFAKAIRENATSTDALFARRAGSVATMNAVDNMHSYAQIARAYADDTEHLATAFDSLYASLSDTQKQAADTLFRQQAAAAAQPHARR